MNKKQEKIDQIIIAATEEFLSKGVDAASMHNIAEQAGVSKRTLYKYYSTKAELYDALIDEVLDQVEIMYQFKYSSEISIKQQIESIVETKIKLTLNDSFLKISKIVIGELFKNRMPSQEQMDRLNKSDSMFVAWIRSAQTDKKLTASVAPEDMAGQFHSILKGQIYWPLLMNLKKKDDLDLVKVGQSTVDFFMKSFCD
ncbi:MAG: TetR/AcrR family transcriptional regulator [Bacteriovoracaceae bacterium]|nr:TetR/AcrR family transcriptional regulator [Bacteriovoracaceae bacterium]